MEQYEKAQEQARKESQKEKNKEQQLKKEKESGNKKYEAQMKKVSELQTDGKFGEAYAQMPKVAGSPTLKLKKV